jgi:hypothetical protein
MWPILLFAVLIFMAWQDFKFRAIYWWLFVLVFMLLGQIKLSQSNWQVLLNDWVANVAFLALQILCLSVYFSCKERRWVNIFKQHLGLGDLLFLFSITCYFSFFNYILFYVMSLLVCLLLSLLINVYSANFKAKIPLAGMQAIVLCVALVLSLLPTPLTLTSDLAMLNYLGF